MPPFLPVDQEVSFTLRLFGTGLFACALSALLAAWRGWRRLRLAAILGAAAILVSWGTLWAARPGWLRAALRDTGSLPWAAPPEWTERAPGLETADLEVWFEGEMFDRLALVRVDPGRWRFSVHWDPSQTRTAEDWQRALGAVVVVNGSYFLPDGTPQTPLRTGGRSSGPERYPSSHGAFVGGMRPDILDLNGTDAAAAIAPYAEAMVSYPMLLDSSGHVRAKGAADWLANRSFVALDRHGRVLLGTTHHAFFSLHRLGEFLRAAPLDVRIALNLDGGPLASQVVRVGAFERVVHGNAEISDGGDVLRLFYQAARNRIWRLPIVLSVSAPAR